MRVVEGRDERGALLASNAQGFALGIVLAAAADHHLGAQLTNGAHLVLRHQLGEADDGLHALLRGGEGQRTAMVTGGGSDHAKAFLLGIQLRHRVARTAQLEAAGGLLRLQLQPHRHTGQATQAR